MYTVMQLTNPIRVVSLWVLGSVVVEGGLLSPWRVSSLGLERNT